MTTEKNKTKSVMKIGAENRIRLENMKENIETAEHALSVMERLGMDVSNLKESLEWSKQVRDTLLEEFG